MTQFTPWASLTGGIMIGMAVVLVMLWEGRIAGISGIAARLLPPYRDSALPSRLGFVAGLACAPLIVLSAGGDVQQTVSSDIPLMAVAGLLVGFGTAWGNGCTSGHGVCGLARLSPRSLAATAVFMTAAFVTVFTTRHIIGG